MSLNNDVIKALISATLTRYRSAARYQLMHRWIHVAAYPYILAQTTTTNFLLIVPCLAQMSLVVVQYSCRKDQRKIEYTQRQKETLLRYNCQERTLFWNRKKTSMLDVTSMLDGTFLRVGICWILFGARSNDTQHESYSSYRHSANQNLLCIDSSTWITLYDTWRRNKDALECQSSYADSIIYSK